MIIEIEFYKSFEKKSVKTGQVNKDQVKLGQDMSSQVGAGQVKL